MKPALAAAVLAAFAALALGCGSKPAAPDKPTPVTEPATDCTAPDDCDLVDACCGCSAGGKKLAIRKDAIAGFLASREQRCGDVVCLAVMSTDPSCDAEAICGSRNRCRVAPHMQHQ
jgi:hypothetical protein